MSNSGFTLVPLTVAHKAAFASSPSSLADSLGLRAPEDWPEFPRAFEVGHSPDPQWPGFLFVDEAEGFIVGNGGYKSPLAAPDEVEIGYEIAPRFRNRGYATRATRTLVARAFVRPEIKSVVAHTLGGPNASNAVLKKCGFALVEDLPSAEHGAIWRWRLLKEC